jgi:hypothetical protein
MKNKITFSLLFLSLLLFSQNKKMIEIHFHSRYLGHTIEISDEKGSVLNSEKGLEISQLKFYLSQFQFIKNNKIVYSEQNSFHLLDFSQKETLNIKLSVPENIDYDTFQFFVGVDKETNNNGISDGDLDPSKGMYWSWQTGYINIKIEGKSKECNTRKNEFAFHLGGFLDDSYTYNSIGFSIKNKDSISIGLDLEKLFSEVDFSKKCQIMIPGMSAVVLQNQFSKIFNVE